MTEWSIVVLVWMSSIFGGQGAEPSSQFPDPLPVRAEVFFPTKEGCHGLVKMLKGPQVPEGAPERPMVRHIIVQDCIPVIRVPVPEMKP